MSTYIHDTRELPTPTGWREPIDQWRLLLISQQRAITTVKHRVKSVAHIARDIKVPPSEVTEEILLAWAGSKDIGPSTRNGYYASLRSFFAHYCEKTGIPDPTTPLGALKRPRSAPRPCPEAVIWQAWKNSDTRVRGLISVMAELGLRRCEAVLVHRRNIFPDLLGHSLLVKGKGGHERIIPLPGYLAEELTELCEQGGGWAFPGDINGHLSPAYAAELVSKALGDGWTAHTLRHRFATVGYANGRDLAAMQDLLGHSNPRTTRIYTALPEGSMLRTVTGAALAHRNPLPLDEPDRVLIDPESGQLIATLGATTMKLSLEMIQGIITNLQPATQ